MVVCLKHVGITDSVRERLKMSIKTLASWSAHALSKRPGNVWPCVLVNVDLFKGLTHSRPEQLVLSCMLQCCLPRSERKRHFARLVGTGQLTSGFPFVVRNSLPPHPMSARARVGFITNTCEAEKQQGL
jgi:hypothetical protein